MRLPEEASRSSDVNQIAPGVWRRRRHLSEMEELVNEALCGYSWEHAQLLRPRIMKALQLRNEVEEDFREAQRKGRK